jgi:hypothetical protein
VLALLRTPVAGDAGPTVLAVFNLGNKPVSFNLASAPPSQALHGHGFDGALEGTRHGNRIELPAHGAYFGEANIA